MRIKNIFTIPDGEKVTEKALRRVLISSICSILLCMTCLAGTTWAWFTVELNNNNNVICIGNWSLEVTITKRVSDGSETAEAAEEGDFQEQPVQIEPKDGKYLLEAGKYDINLRFSSDGAFGEDVPVYVIMKQTLEGKDESTYNHTKLTYSQGDGVWTEGQITYTVNDPVELIFWVTRADPVGAALDTDVEETTEATKSSTEATEPSTEATTASTDAPGNVADNDSETGETDSTAATTEAATE